MKVEILITENPKGNIIGKIEQKFTIDLDKGNKIQVLLSNVMETKKVFIAEVRG